jgi:hypothetical protein
MKTKHTKKVWNNCTLLRRKSLSLAVSGTSRRDKEVDQPKLLLPEIRKKSKNKPKQALGRNEEILQYK